MNIRADNSLHQAIIWGKFIKLDEEIISRRLGRATVRRGTYGFLTTFIHSICPENLAMGAISLRRVGAMNLRKGVLGGVNRAS